MGGPEVRGGRGGIEESCLRSPRRTCRRRGTAREDKRSRLSPLRPLTSADGQHDGRVFVGVDVYRLLTYFKHNVKRVRYSKEALEAKRQREQAKLKEYLVLNDDFLAKVGHHIVYRALQSRAKEKSFSIEE